MNDYLAQLRGNQRIVPKSQNLSWNAHGLVGAAAIALTVVSVTGRVAAARTPSHLERHDVRDDEPSVTVESRTVDMEHLNLQLELPGTWSITRDGQTVSSFQLDESNGRDGIPDGGAKLDFVAADPLTSSKIRSTLRQLTTLPTDDGMSGGIRPSQDSIWRQCEVLISEDYAAPYDVRVGQPLHLSRLAAPSTVRLFGAMPGQVNTTMLYVYCEPEVAYQVLITSSGDGHIREIRKIVSSIKRSSEPTTGLPGKESRKVRRVPSRGLGRNLAPARNLLLAADPPGFRLPFNGTTGINTGPGCYCTHGGPNLPGDACKEGESFPASGEAIDYGLKYQNVVSAEAGEVTFAGLVAGFGNLVKVMHNSGYESLYAHLSQISVASGQAVTRGQVLGVSGCTGTCTGPHLHFEVRQSGQSKWIRTLSTTSWASGSPDSPCAVFAGGAYAGKNGVAEYAGDSGSYLTVSVPVEASPAASPLSGVRFCLKKVGTDSTVVSTADVQLAAATCDIGGVGLCAVYSLDSMIRTSGDGVFNTPEEESCYRAVFSPPLAGGRFRVVDGSGVLPFHYLLSSPPSTSPPPLIGTFAPCLGLQSEVSQHDALRMADSEPVCFPDDSGSGGGEIDSTNLWISTESYARSAGVTRDDGRYPAGDRTAGATQRDEDVVYAGQQWIVGVTVHNVGLIEAVDSAVTAAIPPGLTYVTSTAALDAQRSGAVPACAPEPSQGAASVVCTGLDIAADSSTTFQLAFVVSPQFVAAAPCGENHVSIDVCITDTGNIVDQDASDNCTSDTDIVKDLADLTVTKVSKPDDTALAGDLVVYTLRVYNHGPSYARGVRLTDLTVSSAEFEVVGVNTDPSRTDSCVITPGFGTDTRSSTINCSLATPLEPVGNTVNPAPSPNTGIWTVEVVVRSDRTNDINNEVTVYTQGATPNTPTCFTGTPDPDASNNRANDSIHVKEEADLRISKFIESTHDPIRAGEIFTYTIFVDNLGPSVARNVTISDTFLSSNRVEIQSCAFSVSQGGGAITQFTCSTGPAVSTQFGTDIGTFRSDRLDPIGTVGSPPPAGGHQGRLRASFRLMVRQDAQVTNTARVTSLTPDPDMANNFTTIDRRAISVADLAITKTASGEEQLTNQPGLMFNNAIFGQVFPTAPNYFASTRVTAGRRVQYQVQVRNNGISPAENVVLHDRLPAGVRIYQGSLVASYAGTAVPAAPTPRPGVNCDTGTPGQIADEIRCGIGTLNVGQTYTLVFEVITDSGLVPGAVLENDAWVTSDTLDVNNGNNMAFTQTTVLGAADMSALKTSVGQVVNGYSTPLGQPIIVDSSTSVVAGLELRYQVQLQNNGPSDTPHAVFLDRLPPLFGVPGQVPMTFLRAVGADCRPDRENNLQLVCDAGPMRAGDRLTVDLYFTVNPAIPAGTNLANCVDVLTGATNTIPPGPPPGLPAGSPELIVAWDPLGTNNTNICANTTVLAVSDAGGPTNGSAITKVDVPAEARLDKAVEPDDAIAGNEHRYLISFGTAGPSVATGAQVIDTLDVLQGAPLVNGEEFLRCEGADAATSATCIAGPGAGQVRLLTYSDPDGAAFVGGTGTLTPGKNYRFYLVTRVVPGFVLDAPDTIARNSVTISTTTTDPNAANNADTEDTRIISEADLAASLSDTPPLSASAAAHAASPAGASPPRDLSRLLPAGIARAVAGDITTGAARMTPAASVAERAADPSSALDVAFQAPGFLTCDPVVPGGTVFFEGVVRNLGPADARGVLLNVQLPAGLVLDPSLVGVTVSAGQPLEIRDDGRLVIALGSDPTTPGVAPAANQLGRLNAGNFVTVRIEGTVALSAACGTDLELRAAVQTVPTFDADLLGGREVPPVATGASGAATLFLDPVTRELFTYLTVAGIDNLTAAHIHQAPAGVNGPVIVTLWEDGDGPFGPGTPLTDVSTLSAAQVAALLARELYVNVHTTDFPAGEIRGQALLDAGTPTPDPNLANNVAQVATRIECPRIQVIKTVSFDGKCPGVNISAGVFNQTGQPITFCFEVTNTGTTFLDDIELSDVLDTRTMEPTVIFTDTITAGADPNRPVAPGETVKRQVTVDHALLKWDCGEIIDRVTVRANPVNSGRTDLTCLPDVTDDDTATIDVPCAGVDWRLQLPILGGTACQTLIQVQNLGARDTKVILVAWGDESFCPPQAAGPLKVECGGLLRPGSAWTFATNQVPSAARSAVLYSINATDLIRNPEGNESRFDLEVCAALMDHVVGNWKQWSVFDLAYRRQTSYRSPFDASGLHQYVLDFKTHQGEPIAATVNRSCPDAADPNVVSHAVYTGISSDQEGARDPVSGARMFYAPVVMANKGGLSSRICIQNSGDECTSLELWLKGQDECLRNSLADILTLSPGETVCFDPNLIVGPDWLGSAYIRSTQPLGIVVDTVGPNHFTAYNGVAADVHALSFSYGQQVSYLPLTYSEYQGWDTVIQVQNLEATVAAKVKVYFLDRGGDIVTTLVDWICPRGSQTFFLPVIGNLPGQWAGSARVESQEWVTPGGPNILAPRVVAVAILDRWADAARTIRRESIAYNGQGECLLYDWQLGSGTGGTASGAAVLAMPLVAKSNRGITTEIAITNLVPKPGFTDFVVFFYDQNGLIDQVCQKVNEKQVDYLNLRSYGFLDNGYLGSMVVSAVFWEHDVFDARGGFVRNVVGLGAVAVERIGAGEAGADVPGDESKGYEAFPVFGRYAPNDPLRCPGVPDGFGGR